MARAGCVQKPRPSTRNVVVEPSVGGQVGQRQIRRDLAADHLPAAHEIGHIERGHCFDTVRFELLARNICAAAQHAPDLQRVAVALAAGRTLTWPR